MAEGFTFEASYDGIRIDVVSSSVNHARKVISHTFPKRDGANTEDMGREPREITMEFLFLDNLRLPQLQVITGQISEDGYEKRFREFKELVDGGAVRTLIHPYEGSVRCRIREFSHTAKGDVQPTINCNATFVEEITQPSTFRAGSGSQNRASSQEVRSAKLAADDALSSSTFAASVPAATLTAVQANVDDALTEAERWELNPDLSSREVQLQYARIANSLNADLVTLGALSSIDRYLTHKTFTLLQRKLRDAAEAFTSTTTRIVEITTTEALPLRVIATRFYGATEAEQRFNEMLELNPGIFRPTIIQPGTTLKAFSPTVASSRLVQ